MYVTMLINSEKEYKEYRNRLEIFIAKGTKLDSMELLPEEDKEEFISLSRAIAEHEAAYHPLPGKVSTLLLYRNQSDSLTQ